MRRSFVPDSIPTVAHAAPGASRYRDDLLCTARCQSRRAHKVARVPVCKVGGISTPVEMQRRLHRRSSYAAKTSCYGSRHLVTTSYLAWRCRQADDPALLSWETTRKPCVT